MSLVAKIYAAIQFVYEVATDGPARQAYTPPTTLGWDLVDGVTAGKADKIWFDEGRTLAASTSEDLDLAGVLTDRFGTSLTFAKLRGLILKAAPGNTNDVLVGGAASNQVAGIFADVTDVVRVKPGGTFLWLAPNDGATIVAGTGDKLKLANSSSGSLVTFDIWLIGTSS